MNRKLVIGVGNRDRGDDAAGCLVAEQLRKIAGGHFDVVESAGDISELLEYFEKYEEVILIDAVCSPEAHEVLRWNGITDRLPTILSGASSHVLGVAQALELARALNLLPRCLSIFGIPGKEFGYGVPLSSQTVRHIEWVCQQIILE